MNPIIKALVGSIMVLITTACVQSDKEQCAASAQLAYIGHSGNIFLYDFCHQASIQLTTDARSKSENDMSTYFFYDNQNAWSETRPELVAGISNTGVVINSESGEKSILGAATNAVWSPSGNLIALSNDKANQGITIIDVAGSTTDKWIYGTAPLWLNENRLIYLQYPTLNQSNGFSQTISAYDLSKSELVEVASPQIQLSSPVHSYVQSGYLSFDGSLVALYNSGFEGFSRITLTSVINKDYDSSWWHVLDDEPHTYQWSPTENTLALCEGSSAGSRNELILAKPDQIIELRDSQCKWRSGLSWRPDGSLLAFISLTQDPSDLKYRDGLTIVNVKGEVVYTNSFLQTEAQETLKNISGPWWSPDGLQMAIIADERICITPYNNKFPDIKFKCVVDGTDLAWRP
jgi:hypothetical protein